MYALFTLLAGACQSAMGSLNPHAHRLCGNVWHEPCGSCSRRNFTYSVYETICS